MKNIIIVIFLFSCVMNSCVGQGYLTKSWVVNNISTNYKQKGVNDRFELPINSKGLRFNIVNDTLLILNSKSFNLFCGDTLVLKGVINLKRQKDDYLSSMFPGDELTCLSDAHNTDFCYISDSFMKLMKVKHNEIKVHPLFNDKEQTTCLLFSIEENKQMVLYSANDFLLLFLKLD